MSKERELLTRLVKSGVLGGYSFIAEVKELLAQPELSTNGLQLTKQEPLGFKMVEDFLETYEEVSYDYVQGFNDAVLWAEKHHAITGG